MVPSHFRSHCCPSAPAVRIYSRAPASSCPSRRLNFAHASARAPRLHPLWRAVCSPKRRCRRNSSPRHPTPRTRFTWLRARTQYGRTVQPAFLCVCRVRMTTKSFSTPCWIRAKTSLLSTAQARATTFENTCHWNCCGILARTNQPRASVQSTPHET